MTLIVVCAVILVVCLLCAAVPLAFADFSRRRPLGWPLTTALCGLLLTTFVLRDLLRKRRLARVRRDFDRWQATSGWIPGRVDRIWPWTNHIRAPGMVTVTFAFDRDLGGLPVTVGELSWIDDGLGDATDRWKGRGIFTVVRLPGSPPDFAVRRYRTVYRQRAGEDEFRRRFRTIFNDTVNADRLDHEELRKAHVNNEIPPWTLLDGELFTIVSMDEPTTPAAMESAASDALRVAELIGLRSSSA
ncbi:hypothetical protein ODJ79_27945 [Actinoplanes sp. KI2]|uniref:hypothetical protein n=1 Tax=Actinoplanes sp. KI2 TaxID=2983315 RepID=UPI0021D5E250|nr:hypothetical protein [Actinoplanes sp. KI2]MCU7727568.1 hypothetical protein [Actinoplanes sp. KI2]